MLNKYGTKNDVLENYRFVSDEPVSDVELTLNYEGNGLFARIIDIPADEAVSSGFTYGISDTDIENFINIHWMSWILRKRRLRRSNGQGCMAARLW